MDLKTAPLPVRRILNDVSIIDDILNENNIEK